jgi:hypothetical protein
MDINSLLTGFKSTAVGSTIDKTNSSVSTHTQNSSLVSPTATEALTTSTPDRSEPMQGASNFQGRSDLSFPSQNFSAGITRHAIAHQDPPPKRKAPRLLIPKRAAQTSSPNGLPKKTMSTLNYATTRYTTKVSAGEVLLLYSCNSG